LVGDRERTDSTKAQSQIYKLVAAPKKNAVATKISKNDIFVIYLDDLYFWMGQMPPQKKGKGRPALSM
jgi:hypothetical protein